MTKKVYEVAKQLEMESKELLEKLHSMGIEAKSHSSSISDIDAKAVENMVVHSRRKAAETKIVKAAPHKADEKKAQAEVRIAVKQADVSALKPKERIEIRTRTEAKPAAPRSVVPQRTSTAIPPQGTPLPRSVSVQPPIGIPLPRSASQQPVKAKPEEETPVESKQEPRVETAKAAETPTAVTQTTPEIKTTENTSSEAKTEPVAVGIKKIASSVPAEMKAEIEAEERRSAQEAVAQRREAPRPAPTQRLETNRPTGQSQQGQRPAGTGYQGQRPAGQGQPQGQRPAGTSQQGQRPAGTSQQGQRPAGTGYQGQRPAGQGQPQGQRPAGTSQQGQRPAGPGYQGQRPPSARPDYAKDRDTGTSMPPRQKKPDAPGAVPILPVKKGKKDKPEDKRDKPDVKRDAKKKSPYTPRSMEKPTLKKPRKQKQAQPVEEENRINLEELAPGTKIVNVPITVKGFSEQIEKTTSEIIMALMKLGIMANVNQNLDEDTVVLLGEELGIVVAVDKVEEQAVEEGLELHEDEEEDLKPRPPIIKIGRAHV